ncbi:hypothetical protein ACOMHN_056829 [Nucella lapillus]
MLKQGLAQDQRVGEVSMSKMPHQGTLPQWSRVNTLDKARYPKSFLKDKLQPLESRPVIEGEDRELDVSGMNPAQRAQYLERSLLFLRQQHSDVLRALHSEVEELKRENKDLQHKTVIIQKSQHEQNQRSSLSMGDSTSTTLRSKHTAGIKSREDGSEDVKVIFLEEEIKELKHALRESRNKNTYFQQRLEQSEEACKRQHTTLQTLTAQGGGGGSPTGHLTSHNMPGSHMMMTPMADPGHAYPTTTTTTVATAAPPPQSLAEYHTVIKQLRQINERQAHELESLKSDLRDVLYSHKWTPDAYLLAKAYVTEDDKKSHSAKSSKSALPKISVKDRGQPISEAAVIQDSASLPALPQSVGNKAMERRKRTQVMQKAKLRKQIVPE